MRALLVEDSSELRRVFRKMLEEALGFTVREATDGIEGLAALIEPWDVVVSDLYMPRLDGFAFIRGVRSHPRHRSVPVVAVSGDAHRGTQNRALAAGATFFLPKPVRLADLHGVVARIVDRPGAAGGQ